MKNSAHLLVSIVLYGITLFVVTQWRFPELDEIYFADAPANLILNGQWKSHIAYSQFLYQPLHSFALLIWMLIFGVSHFSVCGFGTFLGWISCVLAVNYATDLKYIEKSWQKLLLIVAFWALNTFTDFETFGRPDNFGMLITILIVYIYLKNSVLPKKQNIFLGLLLIFVGVYEIPVMLFFFVLMIIMNYKDKMTINLWCKNGLYFIVGVLLGELIVCSFFFFNQYTCFYRYIRYTFMSSMNANVSSYQGIFERLYDAYTANWYITSIYLLFIIISAINKYKMNYIIALFILFLPALMVLAGRFVPYYSWIYYIPLCVFIIYTLKYKKIFAHVYVYLLVLSCIGYFVTQWYTTYGYQASTIIESQEIKHRCINYYEKNKKIIEKYDNVVLSEAQLYYDVINGGCEVWFKYRNNVEYWLDTYNYKLMRYQLNSVTSEKGKKYRNHPLIGPLMNIYLKYNPEQPYFPNKGICIYTCDEEREESLKFLAFFGYTFKCINKEGDYCIYEFSNNCF